MYTGPFAKLGGPVATPVPNRSRRLNLTAVLVVLGLAIVLGPPDAIADDPPQALVVLEEDEPQTPYPFLARSMAEQRLGELLFDRFYVRTESGYFDSALFEDGAKAYPGRLQLSVRPDLRFADGQAVTFADVTYSINDVYRSDALGHDLYGWFGMVFGDARQVTDRLGDLTFLITMPDSHPEQLLTTTALYSRKGLNSAATGAPDPVAARRTPLGTGAFWAATPIDSFDDIVLDRNPHRPSERETAVSRLRLLYDQDAARQKELMLGGKADLWVAPPPTVLPEFSNQPAVYRISPYELNQWWYVAVDTGDPVLSDRRVREALDLLVPREQLMEKFGGTSATAVSGPFLPGSAWAAPDVTPTALDEATAAALLGSAGFAREGNSWMREGQALALVLGVQSDIFDDYNDVVYALTDGWENAGIRVKVRAIRPTAWRDVVEAGQAAEEYDLILGRWNVDREESTLDLFVSRGDEQQSVNIFAYGSERVDGAVQAFYNEASGPEREAIMRGLHARLHDDRPYLFLWSLRVNSVYRHDRLAGVRPARFYYYTDAGGWRWREDAAGP